MLRPKWFTNIVLPASLLGSCSPLNGACLAKSSCCNNSVCQRGALSDALGSCKAVRLLALGGGASGRLLGAEGRPSRHGLTPSSCLVVPFPLQSTTGCSSAAECCTKTNVCQKENKLPATLGSCRTVCGWLLAFAPHLRHCWSHRPLKRRRFKCWMSGFVEWLLNRMFPAR